VIPMSPDIKCLCPKGTTLNDLYSAECLPAFSDVTVAFLAELSDRVLNNSVFRQTPDIMAFAYWIRSSRIQHFKSEFSNLKPSGLVFHIAPSNVDMLFMYSWVISCLLGNRNCVRLSSETPESVQMFLELMSSILMQEAYAPLRNQFVLIQYDRDNTDITQVISNHCQRRVIWGGNETVRRIQSLPLPKGAQDIAFPDRKSCAAFDAKAMLEHDALPTLAGRFYNDTFVFQQQACSSPRVVFWVGDDDTVQKARTRFWEAVNKTVNMKNPDIPEILSLDKETLKQSLAMRVPGVSLSPITEQVARVYSKRPDSIDWDDFCGGGFVYETRLDAFDQIDEQLPEEIQTLTVLDLEHVQNAVKKPLRIVKVGQALDFHYIWDGIHLFEALSGGKV